MNPLKTNIPHISDALMVWLQETFPDRLPAGELPPHEWGRLVGQQDVIRKLRHHHERQNALTV